jgi:hypothetical protein
MCNAALRSQYLNWALGVTIIIEWTHMRHTGGFAITVDNSPRACSPGFGRHVAA